MTNDSSSWKTLDPVDLKARLAEVRALLIQAAAVGLAQDTESLEKLAELERRLRETNNGSPADIAELQRALEFCCSDLAAALAAAQASADAAVAAENGADVAAAADGPHWQPLILAPIPGLDMLVGIVKPPLQVIVALLQVIAALLDALAAILIGLPDIFRALIMAAYALLRDIINDLINTGAYMYVDAPGITPTEVGLRETGIFTDLPGDWKAGRELKPQPPLPDGFARWAARFAASFDDPGDAGRPIITEGAPIQAMFIVMAAPSLNALRQSLYLLGRLLNIDQFKVAFDKYEKPTDDPRRRRARATKGTPPNWRSKKLGDLFDLKGLMMLPDALKGLLSSVDSLSGLIKNLAAALHEKANLLMRLAAAIQAIIDLLDALKSTGMYSLGVATQGGVAGLRDAFLSASKRPPGGYIGGICFLASGPNLAKASMLFNLLGGTTAIELAEGKISLKEAAKQGALGKATALLESSTKPVGEVYDKLKEKLPDKISIGDMAEKFVEAVAQAPASLIASTGQSVAELTRQAAESRSLLVEALENSKELIPGVSPIQEGMEQTQQAQRYGARSLALGYGSLPPVDENPPPGDAGAKGGKP